MREGRAVDLCDEGAKPALAAEENIAFAQHRDFGALGDQFRAVTERNRRQIDGS